MEGSITLSSSVGIGSDSQLLDGKDVSAFLTCSGVSGM